MSLKRENGLMPELRFLKDSGENFLPWAVVPLRKIADRSSKKNKAEKVSRVLTNSAVDGVVDQRDYFEKDIAVKGKLDGYYLVQKGDYVYNPRVSSTAPVGPISRNKLGLGVMSPLYTVFRFKEPQNDFYEQYFKSSQWYGYVRRVSNTGARHDRMSITPSELLEMPVPEIEPDEQQKIADCLCSIDKLITAQAEKIEALKAHKKGLMQKLFPAEGKNTPELRFPEFRDSGEWAPKTLGDICDMQAGKFVRVADIKTKKEPNLFPCYGGNGLRGFTESNTHEGKFSLIGRQGALCGNVTLADGTFHATEHAVVTYPREKVSTVWLYYLLIKLNLNQYATGQAQPGLSVENLERVQASQPPNQLEQETIARCLSSIDYLLETLEQKYLFLKYHQKGLMQQLFPNMDEVSQ